MTSIFSLDSILESAASYSTFNKNKFDKPDLNYQKMLKSLKFIIKEELTEKQKICVYKYYGDRLKMCEIAEDLGVNRSTVSRHIKKAKKTIEKTMKYFWF